MLQVSLWHMFGPFENSVWVAVFVSTAVVFMLLWLFDGAKMGTDLNDKIPQVQCIRWRWRHIVKGSALERASRRWCRIAPWQHVLVFYSLSLDCGLSFWERTGNHDLTAP